MGVCVCVRLCVWFRIGVGRVGGVVRVPSRPSSETPGAHHAADTWN